MPLPYLMMALLYGLLALLVALDAALASFSLLAWFSALRWLRVHFITLGLLAQLSFGLTPGLVAAVAGRPRPDMRWPIWVALNMGLLALLVGIPLVNAALIITGGALVFSAAALLAGQLAGLQGRERPALRGPWPGQKFYLAALAFLLLGIFVGTGLWLGWGEALNMARPKEVHLHANLWGFTSLLFAGLMVDLYPGVAGRSLAWPRSIRVIFWMMTLGALGLVLGPWLGPMYFTAPGLAIVWLGTVWLLANVIVPLRGSEHWRQPGLWHWITAYVWLLTPLLLGPLVLAGLVQIPGASAEQTVPQVLVYGWLLQFLFAVAPTMLRRALWPASPARLGGSWFSLAAVLAGEVCLVLAMFNAGPYAMLHGTAYLLWAASLVPPGLELGRIMRGGLARLEIDVPRFPLDSASSTRDP